MLLKISEYGANLGLIVLGILLGGAALLTAFIWGLSNLFRRKERKKSWGGLAIFLVILVVIAIAVFIITA